MERLASFSAKTKTHKIPIVHAWHWLTGNAASGTVLWLKDYLCPHWDQKVSNMKCNVLFFV